MEKKLSQQFFVGLRSMMKCKCRKLSVILLHSFLNISTLNYDYHSDYLLTHFYPFSYLMVWESFSIDFQMVQFFEGKVFFL